MGSADSRRSLTSARTTLGATDLVHPAECMSRKQLLAKCLPLDPAAQCEDRQPHQYWACQPQSELHDLTER